ncbi:hypothetical protein M6B38_294425 [Iris pallida]|uniref:Uncharacterized protein n=1 Tax=Iris pallida TaxID=29817 RepID=A0AAX6GL55_IRIPA|nr:hypothetical protein M6B38_358100 [Iris pallida]KAJ6843983.1 hypothetical protein M6B38_294425 [Iris pallida]
MGRSQEGGGAPCSAALWQDSRRSSMRLAVVGHSSDKRERKKYRERESDVREYCAVRNFGNCALNL